MDVQIFNKSQERAANQCSRSMQDILQLPSITHDDFDINENIKVRAESLDSKDSPQLFINEPSELNHLSGKLKEYKFKKNENIKNMNPRKIQFMRNLAPIERPKTFNGSIHGIKDVDKLLSKEKPHPLNNIKDSFEQNDGIAKDINSLIKNHMDSFKNEFNLKLEQITNKLDSFENKFETEQKIKLDLNVKQMELFSLLKVLEENLKALKSTLEEQILKMDETATFKYKKIKEYFSKFGDQFKTHLLLYDKKRKEIDNKIHHHDNFIKSIPNLLQETAFQNEAKIELFEAEKKEEFKRIFDQIKNFKDELNIHSIVHTEFQGIFELQNMRENDNKQELFTLTNQIKEISNKIDLQMVFQGELENEMKIMNETQGDLFKGMKKHEGDFDNLSRILQNLTSNYNIFKKVQEKETVIKTQLIDLFQDINFLKNKINSDGEMEKSMKKMHMDEIIKLIDQKFELLKNQSLKKEESESNGFNNPSEK